MAQQGSAGANHAAARKAAVLKTYAGFRKPHVPDILPTEVWSRIQAKDPHLHIIDVRDLAEQQVSVLPGPTLTKTEWEARSHSSDYTGHTIVCYCTAGLRSGNFAAVLREQGYEAYNLEGSILGWTHEQLPLVTLADRDVTTHKVHVFAERWALLADGYEPVWHDAPNTVAAVARGVWSTLWSYPARWFSPRTTHNK